MIGSSDDDDRDADESSRFRGRLESFIPNMLRKTMSQGVEAAQITEEVIRSAIGEIRLPKEAVAYLLETAENTKKEVVGMAAREFREFLDSARFHEELARILTTLSFEIRTEIRFVPNKNALKAVVESETRVKNSSDRDESELERHVNETVNEAIRSGASDIADILLGRVLKRARRSTGSSPNADDSPPEKDAEPAATRKRAPRRRVKKSDKT